MGFCLCLGSCSCLWALWGPLLGGLWAFLGPSLQGPVLCLASCLLHLLLSRLLTSNLATAFPLLPTIEVQYAANWVVSLLNAVLVTSVGVSSYYFYRYFSCYFYRYFSCYFCWPGVYGCWVTGLDSRAAQVWLLTPYGWANLGYWLYDLGALFVMANQGQTVVGQTREAECCHHVVDKNDNGNLASSYVSDGKVILCERNDSQIGNNKQNRTEVNDALTKEPVNSKELDENSAMMSCGSVASLARQVVVFVRWWPGLVAHHLGVMAVLWWGILSTTRSVSFEVIYQY